MAQQSSAFGGRIPPHSVETEQALLGVMLMSSEIQTEVVGMLTPEDFYRPAHATIFEAMRELQSNNVNFDHLSLADKLASMQKLDAIGGQAYLVELSGKVSVTSYWERYAEIILRLSTYRKLITAGNRIASLAYDSPEDAQETVGIAEQTLLAVTEKQIKSDFKDLNAQLMPAMERLEELAENKGAIVGTPTGFADLDKITSGFRGGDLIILAARPAVGKTALALNMAVGAARAGVQVAIFSLEMGVEDLTQRILCSEALVSLTNVRNGNMPDDAWDGIVSAMDRLSRLNIAMDDSPSLNITELRAKARRQFRNIDGKEQKGLIIVDYLQLMQPTKRNTESRQVEIAEISRGLKILAKDLNVPIIALSQLSRAVESRKGMRPQLSDLRESGAIEQDADIVMFIDRNTDPEREGSEDRPEPGTAHLILAKHRNGSTGTVELSFREMFTKFVSMSRRS